MNEPNYHAHHCPKCKEDYLGFNPNCKEAKETLCGACTAKEFDNVS